MQAGTIIEGTNKEGGSVRGRLGELKADSFELRQTKGKKLENRSFRFDDVSHVKQVDREKSAHGLRNGLIVTGVFVGGLMLLAIDAMCNAGMCH